LPCSDGAGRLQQWERVMKRYLCLCLIAVTLYGCAGPATVEAPTWTPDAPQNISAPIELPTVTNEPTATATKKPTFTPIPPTLTPTVTSIQVADDYALQATQSVEHIFASIQDAKNLLDDAVRTNSLDGNSFKRAVDSMRLSAKSVCSLKAPNQYDSLNTIFLRICTHVGKLKLALDNLIKAGSGSTDDLKTPLIAITGDIQDYITASNALGLNPPRLGTEADTSTSAPTATVTRKTTVTAAPKPTKLPTIAASNTPVIVTPTQTPQILPTNTPQPSTATFTPEPQQNCDPSYPTVCIAPPPPDLDCKDVPDRKFTVLPPDPHNFDRDGNGIGCES
jgi:hypothetical protein